MFPSVSPHRVPGMHVLPVPTMVPFCTRQPIVNKERLGPRRTRRRGSHFGAAPADRIAALRGRTSRRDSRSRANENFSRFSLYRKRKLRFFPRFLETSSHMHIARARVCARVTRCERINEPRANVVRRIRTSYDERRVRASREYDGGGRETLSRFKTSIKTT